LSDAKIDALSRVALFAGSSQRELEFLVSRTDEVNVPAGQTLIKQGSLGDTFYLLLDGEATVDVETDAVRECELPELGDRVDGSVAVVPR